MLSDPTVVKTDFACRIEGFDMRTMTAEEEARMRGIMARYPIIILADQTISAEEQIAFAERFGPIDGQKVAAKYYKPGVPWQIFEFSNVDEQRNILPAGDKRQLLDLGNRFWHSDSSFKKVPSHHSMLYAIAAAGKGGETQFADMHAAYDTLPDDWRVEIEGLIAEHSVLHSRLMMGFGGWSAEELEAMKPGAVHPLIRTLPESGRRTLYLSAHASHIIGMSIPEGRMLLHELTEHATAPAHVYTHVWRERDFVIWDNRCTMHRLRRYDTVGEKRVMRRVSTVDTTYAPIAMPEPAREMAS